MAAVSGAVEAHPCRGEVWFCFVVTPPTTTPTSVFEAITDAFADLGVFFEGGSTEWMLDQDIIDGSPLDVALTSARATASAVVSQKVLP